MNRKAAARRPDPYLRPMQGWWRRDPFFVRYMAREATAVAVGAYAILLTVGIVRLAQGESEWNGWLDTLRTPWAMLLHGVLLAAMIYHAYSWFDIMPKTMPMLFVGGRRVAASTITRVGWAATLIASIVFFAFAAWWRT